MKIVLLFSLFLLTVLYSGDDIEYKNGVKYKIEYDFLGLASKKTPYKNHKKNGTEFFYRPKSDNISDEKNWKMGIKHGLEKTFTCNGFRGSCKVNNILQWKDGKKIKTLYHFDYYKNSNSDEEFRIEEGDKMLILRYPKNVKSGEIIFLRAFLYDDSQKAKSGGITLSFPEIDDISFDKVDSSFSSVKGYPVNSKLWSGIYKKTIKSKNFSMEGWESKLQKRDSHYFEVALSVASDIKKLKIDIRGIFVNKKHEIPIPLKGNVDQQGYPVKSIEIEIKEKTLEKKIKKNTNSCGLYYIQFAEAKADCRLRLKLGKIDDYSLCYQNELRVKRKAQGCESL